ncbi:hypothetical protein RND81_05G027500 [Saponaria officinalis]|uniref:Uncharacterized protein n=1 Tax=Saponaria officinalis TaxID=3572 RepID=A0AAW1KSP9_SAPOF
MSEERDYEKILETVCYIVRVDDEGYPHVAGGVCIGEDGVFATVCHFLDINSLDNKIKLRLHKEVGWRNAQVSATFPESDLAILVVSDSQKMKFASVPETIDVNWGDPLLGVTHALQIPFTVCFGNVGFSFPSDTEIPQLSIVPRDSESPPVSIIDETVNCIPRSNVEDYFEDLFFTLICL